MRLPLETPFGAIIADPPWKSQVGGGRIKRGADRHYGLMNLSDIKAMRFPVKPDATLFLWTTWNDIPNALEVIEAWGFRYVTGFPWLKVTNGIVNIGLGQYFRGCSEPVLFATRGRVSRLAGNSPLGLLLDGELVFAKPRMEHSRKPDTLYEIAELYEGPYLELFARNQRKDWTSWGDEVSSLPSQRDLFPI